MTASPESVLLGKLAIAAGAVATGADDAIELIDTIPSTVVEFAAMSKLQRTAVRALLKAIEQLEDVLARMFRTFLIAEQVDITGMRPRDIANRIEKLGGLADAIAAVPALQATLSDLSRHLRAKGYLA